MEWQACSLDINPIKIIWYFLKNMVFKLNLKSTQRLKYSMQKAWVVIDPNKCEDLVMSMSGRIKAIIKTKSRT